MKLVDVRVSALFFDQLKNKLCWICTKKNSHLCFLCSIITRLPPAERCRAAWAGRRRRWRAQPCRTTAWRFSTTSATWPSRHTTSTPCWWPPATSWLTCSSSCCAWWGTCWSASSWWRTATCVPSSTSSFSTWLSATCWWESSASPSRWWTTSSQVRHTVSRFSRQEAFFLFSLFLFFKTFRQMQDFNARVLDRVWCWQLPPLNFDVQIKPITGSYTGYQLMTQGAQLQQLQQLGHFGNGTATIFTVNVKGEKEERLWTFCNSSKCHLKNGFLRTRCMNLCVCDSSQQGGLSPALCARWVDSCRASLSQPRSSLWWPSLWRGEPLWQHYDTWKCER